MVSFRRFLCLAGCLATLALPVGALAQEAPGPDPELKAALDKMELKYDVGKDGDVKLTFALDDERSQLVFIQSSMEQYGGLKIREIWAPAFKTAGPLPAELANQLLSDSQERKLGGWQMMSLGEENLVVYAVKVPNTTNPDDLMSLIQAVMVSADEMEKQVTGKDDY